jgi:hypothetical protein
MAMPAESFIDLSADILDDEDADEESWHVQLPSGDVTVLSLEQLDDAFRLDIINEHTNVWQSGMQNWISLGTLIESTEPAVEEEQDESWHVVFGPGEVRELSLEQLDDAFRLEVIDENTLVWKPGMQQWMKLGLVAGLETPATESRPAVSVPMASSLPPASVTPLSVAPVALTLPPPPERDTLERWVFGLAILAGVLLFLYRNDFIHSALAAAGQQARFESAEQRFLGGPTFGTGRRVQKLIADQAVDRERIRLPAMLEEEERRAREQAEQEAAAKRKAEQEARAQRKAEEEARAKAKAEAEAQRLKAEREALEKAAQQAAERAAAPGKKPRVAPKKSKGSFEPVIPGAGRGRGHKYDPLNPVL